MDMNNVITKKVVEICKPLRDIDNEIYNICVEKGYDMAKETLSKEIDNAISSLHMAMGYGYEYSGKEYPYILSGIISKIENNVKLTDNDILELLDKTVDGYLLELREYPNLAREEFQERFDEWEFEMSSDSLEEITESILKKSMNGGI